MFSILFPLLCFFLGCKPEETTLSGQVFTSTPLGTLKLGDAQIFLVEKATVLEFLAKKQLAIDSESSNRKHKFDLAESELLSATTAYTNFLQAKPYQNNSDYVKAVSDLENLIGKIEELEKKFEPLRIRSRDLRNITRSALSERTAEYDYLDFLANSIFSPAWSSVTLRSHQAPLNEPIQMKAWRNFLETSQKEMSQTKRNVGQLQSELEYAEARMFNIQRSAEAVEKNRVSIARTHVELAKSVMLAYPGKVEDSVLKDLPTVSAIKTSSDSDGKFIVSYPKKRVYSVFARAQWKLKGDHLSYCWLVDAPKDGSSLFILSNNKLVDADPDNYLLPFKRTSLLRTD